MNIKNFNAGDIIVRTEAGKKQEERQNENLGISTLVTVYEDSSYLGEPLKLLDIANGMIYLEVVGEPVALGKRRELSGLVFSEGWNYFVVPDGYTMEYFQTKKIV